MKYGDKVDSKEAAKILGRSRDTLAEWRKRGFGPQPVGAIGRSLLYDQKECERFAELLKKVGRDKR